MRGVETMERRPQGGPEAREAPLLSIRDLAVSFESGRGEGRRMAVDGVDLSIHRGQTVALVGESGCGKSVTALSVLRLLASPAARYERGSIEYGGRDLLTAPAKRMLEVRGGEIAMIFQEPMTSLNPVLNVGEQIIEAIMRHQRVARRAAKRIAIEAMEEVGIREAGARLGAYPHEFSGGMRQRVMIAMALACRSKLLLADEPTTALDVTIQAQILALLDRLRRQRGLGILFITHDLGVVAGIADVVYVMFSGRVVECADVFTLFARPLHPYTRGLLGSMPRLDERRARLRTVEEVIGASTRRGDADDLPEGIEAWWPTSSEAVSKERPPCLAEVEPGHWVACARLPEVTKRVSGPPDSRFRRNAAGA